MSGILCRASREQEVPRLKELWRLCFGDEEEYIDHYFTTYYRPERALVLEAEGEVWSMLLTFPFLLTQKEGTQCPACYIYAFCTHPQVQGRGYGRSLLAFAEKQAKKEGCSAAVMVPGEESLFRFYETLGYRSLGWLREAELFPTAEDELRPVPCTAEAYHARRESLLSGTPHVSYDGETLAYQERLCRSSGGGFFLLGQGAAAVEPEEDTLFVKELLYPQPEAGVSALLTHFHAKNAVVRVPVSAPGSQSWQERPFAVVKPLGEALFSWQRGWLAFGFD